VRQLLKCTYIRQTRATTRSLLLEPGGSTKRGQMIIVRVIPSLRHAHVVVVVPILLTRRWHTIKALSVSLIKARGQSVLPVDAVGLMSAAESSIKVTRRLAIQGLSARSMISAKDTRHSARVERVVVRLRGKHS